jgi:hypothetical protein
MTIQSRIYTCLLISLLIFVVLYKLYSIQEEYTTSLCSIQNVHDLVDTRAHGSIHYIDQHCPARLFELNSQGRSVFAHAIAIDNKDIINFLYDRTAGIHTFDKCRESYIHLAACRGNMELLSNLSILYSHLKNEKSTCSNITPIQCARTNGYEDIARFLEGLA